MNNYGHFKRKGCDCDAKKRDDDQATNDIHKNKQCVNPYSMIQTINNNKLYLTKQKIAGAYRA